MALDPSIILQAGKGVTPIDNPLDVMAKGVQIQGMQQAQQMNAQKMEAMMREQAANMDAAKRQRVTAGLNELGKAAEWVKGQGINAPHAWDKAIDYLSQQYPELSQYKGKFDLGQIDLMINQARTWDQIQKEKEPVSPEGKVLRDASKGIIPQETSDALMAKATYIKPETESLSDVAKVDMDFRGGRIDKPTRDAMVKKLTHIAPTASAMVGGGAAFDPSKPLDPAMESEARARSKTGERLTPSSRNPFALPINARSDYLSSQEGSTMGEKKQQFASIGEARKYWTTGQGATAFRQQETILHHSDSFIKIADALNSGDIQGANKLGASLGAQFGSDKATNYKIVSQIMSAEVGKYLSGGQSTESERSELAHLIPVFSSPQQAKSGLQTLKTLVEGQRKSWVAQRDAALSGKIPGIEPADSAPKRLSPQEAAALPPGTKFVGMDGVERTKH